MRFLLKILALVLLALGFLFFAPWTMAKERQGTVTIQVNLKAPADNEAVKLWLPYPMSDENQDITGVHINGNYSAMGIYREAGFRNNVLYAQWSKPLKERTLTYTFRVKRKERIDKNIPSGELAFSPEEFKPYLASTSLGPTEGKVKAAALKITQGKKTTLAKARAVYDWIVDNMHRDPQVKGCGFGEVERLLENKGGKCADLHAVFVALARAAGVPAREVFGIRLPQGKTGDMTKAQHCWAEFYLGGYGWVAVDPADVRKIILEKGLTLEQAKPYREYYFGAVDENRIAFGIGRDIVLNPPAANGPLNYFMYPYAEAEGKILNEDLYGFNLGYQISFREQ